SGPDGRSRPVPAVPGGSGADSRAGRPGAGRHPGGARSSAGLVSHATSPWCGERSMQYGSNHGPLREPPSLRLPHRCRSLARYLHGDPPRQQARDAPERAAHKNDIWRKHMTRWKSQGTSFLARAARGLAAAAVLGIGSLTLPNAVSPAAAAQVTVTHWGVLMYGAPYAVAIEKGFYKEGGVDVTGVLTSKGGGTTMRNVMAA